MNPASFVQCQLRRLVINPAGTTGYAETNSYLPEKYAAVGRSVCLRTPSSLVAAITGDGEGEEDGDGDWVRWDVVGVGDHASERPDPTAAIRIHRRLTGDSLPRLSSLAPR